MTLDSGNSEAHIPKKRRIHAYVIVSCLLLTGYLPRYSDSFDNIVQIVVGLEAKVLIYTSKFYVTHLSISMRRLKATSKKPTNRKPTCLARMSIPLLYSKKLPLTDKSGEELDEVDLVDLYIFGEA